MARNSAYIKVHVEGGEKLAKMFAHLKGEVRKNIAKKALKAAVKPVIAAAKARVPKRYGALRQSIGSIEKKYPSNVVVTVVGPRRGHKSKLRDKLSAKGIKVEPANYAHLVEFGTKPHNIEVTRARMNAFGFISRVKHTIKHSGAKPKPFMRPAWDANKGNMFNIMAKVIEDEVFKEAQRAFR